MIKNPHNILAQDVLLQLDADPENGLSTTDVQKRQAIYGENKLKRKRAKSGWLILVEQFFDPIIYILSSAMLLAFIFGEWLEGFSVLVVILITSLIGFFMERQAIRSVESLQKMTQTVANVLRDGSIKRIKARYLVPGDSILLASGDVVPADARLIWHQSLAVKESALTGESHQVEKNVDVLPLETRLIEQTNMVFKGTIITRGNAKAIVTATGDKTAIGQISSLTQETGQEKTPLEKKLNRLSHWLIGLTLILAVLIAISGYFQGKDLMLMIKTGIALAVAAIPEGLPIVATIALAKGMVKLSKQKVIIKKLESVQTLGETTIICTDKTGTLTENKMAVQRLIFQSEVLNTTDFGDEDVLNRLKDDLVFSKVVQVGILCNNSQHGQEKMNGDSIEIALLDFAKMVNYNSVEIRSQYPELEEMPFDAEQKIMATLNTYEDQYLVSVKGALESVLDSCDRILTKEGILPFENKKEWYDRVDIIASEGLRVLAFAYKEISTKLSADQLINELVFLGVIAFIDPPRADIKSAIQIYKDAGVKVIMITGDHPDTARKIGEEVGLIAIEDTEESVIHGKTIVEMENLSSKEESEILNAKVFARMVPKQKLDLVNFYQKHNAIVGMIGDGVNDAPAIKKADIGIAMGIRGTEAAKEVADVILMDDQFTSTELAIRQGRTIFENIRNFVVYLLSCNLAEIISVAIASISNLPLPLLPLQILFLNLVTDIFPALALGMGKGNAGIMKQPPRNPNEPIITKKLWMSTIIYGISITISVIGVTIYANFVLKLSSEIINNMAFYTLVLAQLLNVFNIPHRSASFFKNEVTTNLWVWVAIALSICIMIIAYYIPVLQQVLSLVQLSVEQFVTVSIFGVGTLILTQIIKRLGGTV
ncbi:Ca2+-transporting ATPase [Aquimarina sp. MAR_2010_214]|uniref:cation-translocating P-type ATPase n=1 Tax=Aquimarina sp. MAR_2010_214 TaxID=1250026 RepID=UPI000C70ACD5|nr:HAD-IC family P-type ATPase [Aquimarina sp. MAR_2010_214]PKV50633.1 Ca2+-transporting ATPase [Aquimarina sp. MAR_2010_214]